MKFLLVLVIAVTSLHSKASKPINPFGGVSWKDSIEEAATKLISKGYKVGVEVPNNSKKVTSIKKGLKTNSIIESSILKALGSKKNQKLQMFYHNYKDEVGKMKFAPQAYIYLVVKGVNIKGAIYNIKYQYEVSYGMLLKSKKNVITFKKDKRIKIPLILTGVELRVKEGKSNGLEKLLKSRYKFNGNGESQDKLAMIHLRGHVINYKLRRHSLKILQGYYDKHLTELATKGKKDSSSDI